MPRLPPHGDKYDKYSFTTQKMTIIRHDSNSEIDDLLPSEYNDPWPPLSDEEIEERQRQAEWDDYYNSIPDAAERNRNLK